MSEYQKFTVETIRRSDITKASYNPRLIDEENKKRLEAEKAARARDEEARRKREEALKKQGFVNVYGPFTEEKIKDESHPQDKEKGSDE